MLVVKGDGGIARRGCGPRTACLDEQGPVRLVLGEALAVLRGFVVDRAHALAEAECLRLISDRRLVHQGLAVDRVTGESNAPLQGGAREMLDDDICVVGGAGVYARIGRACGWARRCTSTVA